MKAHFCYLSLTLLVLMYPAPAQWVPLNGPIGGQVLCLFDDGARLYAGGQGGVYYSINHGVNWSPSALLHEDVLALAVTGENIMVWKELGITRSTDDGTTWTVVTPPFSRFSQMVKLGPYLYLGTETGVFRSSNNGETWSGAGLAGRKVNCLAESSARLFAGTEDGVYLSTDSGTSWNLAISGLTTSYVHDLCVLGTDIFVAIGGGGVFRSTNHGTNWIAARDGLTDLDTRYLATLSGNIFAGTYTGGVFISTDVGTSWTAVNNGLTRSQMNALEVSGTNLLVAALDGIFISTNNGTSWTPPSVGIPNACVYSLSVSNETLCAGTHGAVQVSTDNGTTWRKTLDLDAPVSSITVSGQNVFAGSGNGQFGLYDTPRGRGVFRSTDGGNSWISANEGLSDSTVNSLVAFDSIVIAATAGGIFRSSNYATEWTRVLSGAHVISLGAWPALGGVGTNLMAGTFAICGVGGEWGSWDEGVVYFSGDAGKLWVERNAGLDVDVVTCFGSGGRTIFAGGFHCEWDWHQASLHGLATVDTVWKRMFRSDSVGTTFTAMAIQGTALAVGTDGGGVFATTNSGVSWASANLGLGNLSVRCLTVSGEYLYAGTSAGVWRRPLSEMITFVDPQTSQLSHEFTLRQNYPNPFNPSTIIKYELPRSSEVRLSVYDLLGREVSVLVNERRDAGVHEVKFDGSGLSSGVYLYRLQAGDFVQTRKLVLLQ